MILNIPSRNFPECMMYVEKATRINYPSVHGLFFGTVCSGPHTSIVPSFSLHEFYLLTKIYCSRRINRWASTVTVGHRRYDAETQTCTTVHVEAGKTRKADPGSIFLRRISKRSNASYPYMCPSDVKRGTQH